MLLLLAIVVGVVIGAIGGYIVQENYDLLILNICMGIVGAVIGDALYFFASGDHEYFLFTFAGLISMAAGALLFVLLFSLLHRAISKNDPYINGPK